MNWKKVLLIAAVISIIAGGAWAYVNHESLIPKIYEAKTQADADILRDEINSISRILSEKQTTTRQEVTVYRDTATKAAYTAHSDDIARGLNDELELFRGGRVEVRAEGVPNR